VIRLTLVDQSLGAPDGREAEGGIVPPVVTLTGMFDHPAATTCRWHRYEPVTALSPLLDPAVGACRLEFAVTRIVVP
jgi:hypothetical protein